MPSEKNCSLYIEGTKCEVLKIAVRRAIEEHGHADSPELQQEIESTLQAVV